MNVRAPAALIFAWNAFDVEAAGGVRKAQGPRIQDVLAALKFEPQETSEATLVEQVLPAGVIINRLALLKDGDRAGLVAWLDSPDVQAHFLALKEALHVSFSTQVRDVIDEIQRREGKPPRNLLTFIDPGLSDERLVFIRVRERLYEFHVANGRDEVIFDLIEELTD